MTNERTGESVLGEEKIYRVLRSQPTASLANTKYKPAQEVA